MGLFLKSKSSHINTIVTSSLFHLMIMVVLASILFGHLLQTNSNTQTILVEMADNAPPTANDKVWAKIEELGLEQFEFIPKEESIKLLQKELGDNVLLEGNNPLKDLFYLVLNPNSDDKANIKASLMSVTGVMEIYEPLGSSKEEPVVFSNGLPSIIKGFLLFLIGILSWIYFNSKATEVIESSRDVITSFSLYGAKPHYFKSSIRKFVFGTSIKSWILGVLLFFLLFHLTLSHFGHGISDISNSKILINVFVPLFLLLIVNNVLINIKLKDCIKSI